MTIEKMKDNYPYTSGMVKEVLEADCSLLYDIFDYNDRFLVAGGRGLSAFDNITTFQQDIDLWFFEESSFIRAENNLKNFCKKKFPFTKILSTKNAVTFILKKNEYENYISVQLIKRIFDNHNEVLNHFDMTNVQIGYIWEKKDFSPFLYTKEFLSSFKRKEIDLLKVHELTLVRMTKLLSKGYTLSNKSIDMLKEKDESYFQHHNSVIDPDATYEVIGST